MGLFKPAWQSDNREKAMNAVARITDYSTLVEITKTALLSEVHIAAMRKLADDQVYYLLASDQITDQALLEDIARSEREWHIRQHALFGMSDQAAIANIAKANCREGQHSWGFVSSKAPNNYFHIVRTRGQKRIVQEI